LNKRRYRGISLLRKRRERQSRNASNYCNEVPPPHRCVPAVCVSPQHRTFKGDVQGSNVRVGFNRVCSNGRPAPQQLVFRAGSPTVNPPSGEIEALARQDQACSRLMTVPGIGPIISSAMLAAIGTGDVFSKGRDFGAWLGLVPKQISTEDRTILGKISRRGNRYLRVLFVHAVVPCLVV